MSMTEKNLILKHHLVAEILRDIEKALRELGLWEAEPPSPEALASTAPFAVDTLHFPQWLQFIFIPRLDQLVEQHADLPSNCSVAPMAEQYFHVLNLNSVAVISHLKKIDTVLSGK